MAADKRAAIENYSSNEIAVNYGDAESGYLIVQRVNLALSSDNCSKIYTLGVRVYSLSHSNNLLFIDFRITDPCGGFTVLHAGRFNKNYITWTDHACSVVNDFYPNAISEPSLILTDNLAVPIYKLARFLSHKKQAIPPSNKAKLDKSKKSRYLKKITK